MIRSAGRNPQTSVWLQIFCNSKVNGAPYEGESLPVHRWAWPQETYLQRRLRALRNDGEPPRPNEDAAPSRRERVLH